MTTLAVAVLNLLALSGPAWEESSFLFVETGGHNGAVLGLAKSPSGWISTGADKSIRIWGQDGSARPFRYATTEGSQEVPGRPVVTKAGMCIVPVRADGLSQAKLLALPTAASGPEGLSKATQVLSPHQGRPAVAYSAVTDRIATVGSEGKLILWNASDLTKIGEAKLHDGDKNANPSCAFSRDGSEIAVSLSIQFHTELRRLSARDLKITESRSVNSCATNTLAFAGRAILFGGSSFGTWQPGQEARLTTSPTIFDLSVAPSGDQVAVGYGGASGSGVQIWSPSGQKLRDLAKTVGPATAVAFESENRLAVGTAVGLVQLLSVPTGSPSQNLSGRSTPLGIIGWTADGSSVAWGTALDPAVRANPKPSDFVRAFNLVDQVVTRDLKAIRTSPLGDGMPTIEAKGNGLRVKHAAGEADIQRPSPPNCFGPLTRDLVGLATGSTIELYKLGSGPLVNAVGYLVGAKAAILSLAASPDARYVAAASVDGMVYIWRLEPDKYRPGAASAYLPLMSLYVDATGEWVLWSPESGVYAASAKGDQSLCVQVNRGPDEVTVAPAFTRRDQFYKPEALKEAFKNGASPAVPRGSTMAETQLKCPWMQVSGVFEAGGTADKRLPQEGASGVFVATNPRVKIRLNVTEDVDTVELSVNNPMKEVQAADEGSRRTVEASLTTGLNILRIVAKNRFGESNHVVLAVTYGGTNDETNLKVLSIGIGAYEDFQPLPAARDAKLIGEAFEKQNKRLGKVDVTVLDPAKTNRQDVMQAIQSFAKQVQPTDTAVLYISSHGTTGKKDGKEEFFLVPTDGNSRSVAQTCLSWSWILDELKKLPCRGVVLIQDTCHAGGIVADQLNQLASARTLSERSVTETNIATFSSCGASELSYYSPEDNLSVFTMALERALSGSLANVVTRGYVRLGSLEVPVQDEVERILADLHAKDKIAKVTQRPHLNKVGQLDVKLAAVAKQ